MGYLQPIIKEIQYSGVELRGHHLAQLRMFSETLYKCKKLTDDVIKCNSWNIARQLYLAKKMEDLDKKIFSFARGPYFGRILADIHHLRADADARFDRIDRNLDSLNEKLGSMKIWGSESMQEAVEMDEMETDGDLGNFGVGLELGKREVKEMFFNLKDEEIFTLLWLDPVRSLPSNFRPEILVKLQLQESNLNKLWEGIQPLTGLRNMDLSRSEYLKELPDLSMAINLEILDLSYCSSLLELPSSIKNLNKLETLKVLFCKKLETLPTGINLQSLYALDLRGCSRFRSFPEISTNISRLYLDNTLIEEVPWWIENFSNLTALSMRDCSRLKCVSLHIYKLKHLKMVDFSDCRVLTRVDLSGYSSEVAMGADNIDTVHEKASSSLPDSCVPKVDFYFMDCFNLDQEALLQQQSVFFKSMIFSGEEVSSYFTHQTTGNSLTNIPLLQSSPSQPFFKLRACAIVDPESVSWNYYSFSIQVFCQFKDTLGNHFDYADLPKYFRIIEHSSHLLVFDCCFTLNEGNAPPAELNYNHVDIQFHLVDDHSQLKLKGCGIHLLDDGSFLDDRPCNPYILPEVCEGDNNTRDNLGVSKFYKKSIRGDNFLGEVNSDATSNSRKSIEIKKVGLVKEENKHENVSKSSTMVTDERRMPQHQVFINFGGEEVRFSFISHLVSALSREGVNIFIGKYEKRGEDRDYSFQSIEDSNIALVIFSSTYTESRWCLEELVKIKEQMDEDRIIPIFYKVQLSHVKELDGDFGLQFWKLWRVHRDHQFIDWKNALESVASIKGFELKEKSSESEFITSIVEEVLRMISLQERENPHKLQESLNKCPPFGLEQRMQQLEHKLEFDCNETRIIGVVGMAGIGKTNLAMMLYDKWNCDFIRCVALLGIRKKLKDNEWLKKTLFEVLLEGECYKSDESLKGELLKTKVFVVLDDVSNKKQLEFLLSGLNWIKKGSKIVITSCDKSLIEEFVHDTYVVPPLNYVFA